MEQPTLGLLLLAFNQAMVLGTDQGLENKGGSYTLTTGGYVRVTRKR